MIQAVAPPDLPERWTGKIHSIFANSCNVLLDGGELLTIHRFSFGMLPRSLYVPGLSTGELEHGAPVTGGPEGVSLGNRLLKWSDRLRRTDTAIPRSGCPPRNWREPLALLRQRQSSLEGGALTDALYSRLRRAMAGLWSGLRTGDDAAVREGCLACIGLGQGLTPSGDDMLLGTMAGLHMYRPELACRLAAGIRPLLERTNDISRSYLELVLAGYAATPVLDAAAELGTGGTEAARLLMTIGHSSGCDILEGLVTTAEQLYKTEEEGRL